MRSAGCCLLTMCVFCSEWKNYFLEHLDRLYRKTSTRRVEGLPPPLPHQRPPSSSDQDHAQKAL